MDSDEEDFPEVVSPFLRYFAHALVVVVCAVFFFMLLSFPIGAYTVYSTDMGASETDLVLDYVPMFFLGIPLPLPIFASTGDVFAFIWVASLIIFVIGLGGPTRPFHKVLSRASRDGHRALLGNTVATVILTYSALILIITFVEFLQEMTGIHTGFPPEDQPIALFTLFSLSPFVEEFGFRITIVGLATLLLVKRPNGRFSSIALLWHPIRILSATRSEDSLKRDLRKIYVIVIIEGFFFGASHILYGTGWEWGKITTATLSGIILGWMYIHYGAPGAILLHWAFNYFTSSYYFFEKAVGSVEAFIMIDVAIFSAGSLAILIPLLSWRSRRIEIEQLER